MKVKKVDEMTNKALDAGCTDAREQQDNLLIILKKSITWQSLN